MDLGLILNLVGLASKFIPAGSGTLGTIVSLLATYGAPISALVKAGEPVLSAVEKNSPQLLEALKQFALAFGDGLTGKEVEAVAKAIFVPHMTTEQERVWMDRASFNTGQ